MKRLSIGSALFLLLLVGVSIVVYAFWQIHHYLTPKPASYSAQQLGTQGKAQLSAGNYATAENYLQQALQKEDDHTYRSDLAVVEYRLKKYPEAIVQYQALITKKQDVAFAQNGIGNANRDWGTQHYPEAEAAYSASIDADKGYVAAYSNQALLLVGENRRAEALTTLDKGIIATHDQNLITLKNRL